VLKGVSLGKYGENLWIFSQQVWLDINGMVLIIHDAAYSTTLV